MIIFAKPRKTFESYTDLWTLVDFSGFPTCFVDEIDLDSDNIYITTPINGELQALPRERKCTIVWWALERPGAADNSSWVESMKALRAGFIDKVFVSDLALQKLIPGSIFVPVGGHPDFGTTEREEPLYDFTHQSYVHGRRAKFWEGMRGYKIGPSCWGEARDYVVKRSKFMVNIHQDDDGYIEPLRFIYAASMSIPIISEHCLKPQPYVAHYDFTSLTLPQLHTLRWDTILVENYPMWQRAAFRLRQRILERPFRKLVEEAL